MQRQGDRKCVGFWIVQSQQKTSLHIFMCADVSNIQADLRKCRARQTQASILSEAGVSPFLYLEQLGHPQHRQKDFIMFITDG